MKVLVNTYYFILPGISNIGGLLMLLIFIYVILGMHLFGQIPVRPFKVKTANTSYSIELTDFSSFEQAFITLL